MWPLTGLEVARACGAATWAPSIEALSISGAVMGDEPFRDGDLFAAIREEGCEDGHAYVARVLGEGAALALVAEDWDGLHALAPSLRERCLVVLDSLVAYRRLAAFVRRRFSFPVIAVGGSNGKTTTKEMLATLLSGPKGRVTKTAENMNGWSGVPLTLLQRAHSHEAPPDALVVEIGIDAPGAMAEHAALVDAEVALLTSLGPEHLAGLGSLETVVREEMMLLERSPRATRVFQMADPLVRSAMVEIMPRDEDVLVCAADEAASLGRRGMAVLGFEVDASSPVSSEVTVSWQPARTPAPAWRATFTVPMPGLHNAASFALAVAVAALLGRTAEDISAAWRAFVPPGMRCEVRELANGCVLVDDAYNASPASMRAALALLAAPAWRERRKVAILGDMLELGTSSERLHLELREVLAALVEIGTQVCLFGTAMEAVHRELETAGTATTFLPAARDPRELLDDVSLAGAVVLVKGSRGMHLERVVAEIVTRAEMGESTDVTDAELAPFRERFQTACVTGTNGKTTTTSLIAAIVEAAGEPAARVTTLGAWVGRDQTAEEPTGTGFVKTLALAAERGVRTLAVETTSHALAAGFAQSWPSRVAVFTNLSRDHLDYHGTPERYLAAKAQLFMSLPTDGVAVLNLADPASALLDEVTPPGVRRLGYAARAVAPECAAIPLALSADAISIDVTGTHARLASPVGDALGGRLDLALVGDVHVENALAAALAGVGLGYPLDIIRTALATFAGVPGRFEVVHRAPLVVVDFAHTPDALERTLSVARALVTRSGGQVVLVFGCGGDRDPGKRREMGAVAAAGADVIFVTSDNPRSEDPAVIAAQIEEGANEGKARLVRLLDRAAAIRGAVAIAGPGDILVIAGKGHEKTQAIGERELPFDDVEIARDAVAGRSGGEVR